MKTTSLPPKVGVRSTYTILSPDLTCRITLDIFFVLQIVYSNEHWFAENKKMIDLYIGFDVGSKDIQSDTHQPVADPGFPFRRFEK